MLFDAELPSTLNSVMPWKLETSSSVAMLNPISPFESVPTVANQTILGLFICCDALEFVLLVLFLNHAIFVGTTDIGAEDSIGMLWNCAIEVSIWALKNPYPRFGTDVASISKTNNVEIYASLMLCYML